LPHDNIRLRGLQPEHPYAVDGLEGEYSARFSGRELMEWLFIEQLEEMESLLLRVDKRMD